LRFSPAFGALLVCVFTLGAASTSAADTDATEARPAPSDATGVEEILVTARRRVENQQDVPIPLTVIDGATLDDTGTYNALRLTQLAPTFNYISSNPRNTNYTIRGLGASFGLANDGLEPGVGFYIDQVYYARPAVASFDLLDVQQVEILRGPQGTLFGKNTTAGAVNITTREPTFDPEARLELSGGQDGYKQSKAMVSGALVDDILAGRLAAAGTVKDGTLDNVSTGNEDNGQKSVAVRGQLLYDAASDVKVRLSGDYNRQDAKCCTQLYVTYGQTLKPAAQQYPALAAAAGYAPPSTDPYDRKSDVNSRIQARSELGGTSLIVDWDLGAVTLTSVSAWRYWNWDPANDRDYTALSINTVSKNPDKQDQYSEELRIASNGDNTVDWVAGLYAFTQTIEAQPVAEYGAAATRWLLTPSTLPVNLLDGYRSDADTKATTDSYAAFAQITWSITDRLEVTPGIRYTYEEKDGRYDQTVSGGLATTDPALIAKKLSIVRPQSYSADFSDNSTSGQVNVSYKLTDTVLAYTTYARGYKSGGINMAGIPNDAAGNPALTKAVVDPEEVTNYEVGLKSQFFDDRVTANLAAFYTKVHDYQANVVDTGPGALRGYLANVDQVRVKGIELDAAVNVVEGLTTYARVSFNSGEYESFDNGPCPLELIGTATTSCDLSGKDLPGLSKWVVSTGGEYQHPLSVFGYAGAAYFGAEGSYRSSFYSDAADSVYMKIDAYSLLNLRAGFRTDHGTEVFVWSTNVLDKDYLTLESAQAGNSGLVIGVPGDPRATGVTLRVAY
jgi:iron complex outermembrane receptor protein